jgi:16S rRNA (uracil1498-N3)-methyltransferase
MKLTVGETVEIVNGRGSLAEGEIQKIDKKAAYIQILNTKHEPLSQTRCGLAIPLMRPSKIEWVIEKGTELNASAFYLFSADYSEKESLSENALGRLRTLAISALKQSGRLYLPSLEMRPSLEALFDRDATLLFGDLGPSAQHHIPPSPSLLFVSGPERGFSEREAALLKKKALGIRLNPNVLRAETAPIAALSILSFSQYR